MANKGISMDLLTLRDPGYIITDNACEHRLGAFHTGSGRVFTWYISPKLQGRCHINLQILDQVIQIWLEFEKYRLRPNDYILAMTDNTCTTNWLQRSNFREERGGDKENTEDWLVKQQVAQICAKILLEAQAYLADYVGSKSLSRDRAF